MTRDSSTKILKEDLPHQLLPLRQILGDEHVLIDQKSIRAYAKDSGFTINHPTAIVRPSTKEELIEVVRTTRALGFSLHSISRGKNWGYGAACPVHPGDIVLDLSRMNRICHYDAELAYVVIEPGVTQEQLFQFLLDQGDHLIMDVTGASPSSSIIGNLLERGYGQSRYGDRFHHSCGFEVLLADGSIIRTGLSRFAECRSSYLYRGGVGPLLEGLFTQSNFGIVLSAGIWLMRKPARQDLFLGEVSSDELLAQAMPTLRNLKLEGLLTGTVHISNEMRVLPCFAQHPHRNSHPIPLLQTEELERLRKQFGVAPWLLFTAMEGPPAVVRVVAREARRRLQRFMRIWIVSRGVRQLLGGIPRWMRERCGIDLGRLDILFDLVRGKPSHGPTLGMYWRSRKQPNRDHPQPLEDGVGVVWFAPILPATTEDTRVFLRVVRNVCESFGFETNLTLTLVSERALCATIALCFSKEDIEEESRARRCYEVLLRECARHGFIPYRHGINIDSCADILFPEDSVFQRTLTRLKDTLDPDRLFAPGKYGIF